MEDLRQNALCATLCVTLFLASAIGYLGLRWEIVAVAHLPDGKKVLQLDTPSYSNAQECAIMSGIVAGLWAADSSARVKGQVRCERSWSFPW